MRGVWLTRLLVVVFVAATAYGAVMFDSESTSSESLGADTNSQPLAGDVGESAAAESADDSGEEMADTSTPQQKERDDGESNFPITPSQSLTGGLTGLTLFLVSGFMFEFLRVVILIALVAPMVARKQQHREDDLTKGRILGYIEANAGIHFTALRDGLGLANGVTAYHTNNLEREGKIFSWKSGKHRRYASYLIPKKERLAIQNPLSGTRLAILEVLADKGQVGIATIEIRNRLEISRQLLNHHMHELRLNQLIEKTDGKKKFWRASEVGVRRLEMSRQVQETM